MEVDAQKEYKQHIYSKGLLRTSFSKDYSVLFCMIGPEP